MSNDSDKFHETQLKAVLAKLRELEFEDPKKISLEINSFSFLVKNDSGIQFEFKSNKKNALAIELEPPFSWIRSIAQVLLAVIIANLIITEFFLVLLELPIGAIFQIPMIFLVLFILNVIRYRRYRRTHAITLMALETEFRSLIDQENNL